MTDTKKQIIELYNEQDASGKKFIFNMVFCTAKFGEPFLKEMQELSEQGKKAEMQEAIKRWVETAYGKKTRNH